MRELDLGVFAVGHYLVQHLGGWEEFPWVWENLR